MPMSDNGFIKLHRPIQEHWLWERRKFSKFEAWIDLLFLARWKDGVDKVLIKGRLIECGRGQLVRSMDGLADRWGWNRKAVHSFLRLLEKEGMVGNKNETVTTQITICNYDYYQSDKNGLETRKKRLGNGKGQALDTEEESKESINNTHALWKTDYTEYKKMCDNVFRELKSDDVLINKFGVLYPDYDYKRSLFASYDYWSSDDGWKKKRGKKSNSIDWRLTVLKTIKFNLLK